MGFEGQAVQSNQATAVARIESLILRRKKDTAVDTIVPTAVFLLKINKFFEAGACLTIVTSSLKIQGKEINNLCKESFDFTD